MRAVGQHSRPLAERAAGFRSRSERPTVLFACSREQDGQPPCRLAIWFSDVTAHGTSTCARSASEMANFANLSGQAEVGHLADPQQPDHVSVPLSALFLRTLAL